MPLESQDRKWFLDIYVLKKNSTNAKEKCRSGNKLVYNGYGCPKYIRYFHAYVWMSTQSCLPQHRAFLQMGTQFLSISYTMPCLCNSQTLHQTTDKIVSIKNGFFIGTKRYILLLMRVNISYKSISDRALWIICLRVSAIRMKYWQVSIIDI